MRWSSLIVVVSTLLSCSTSADESPTERWRKIKQEIRGKFPNVPHWTTQQVRAAVDGGNVVLVDVREPSEFSVSHLPGARHVTGSFADALATDKHETIVVYCSVGYRSAAAAEQLRQAGFTKVRNYLGSIFEWANHDLPLIDAEGPTDEVHPYDAHWGRLLER